MHVHALVLEEGCFGTPKDGEVGGGRRMEDGEERREGETLRQKHMHSQTLRKPPTHTNI